MLKNVFFAVFLTLAPTYAVADMITFGNLSETPIAAGAHIEGLFTYQLSTPSNNGFSLNASFGNPASGLLTSGSGGPFPQPVNNLGSTIDIFLTGGGLFTFTSFQIACVFCAPDDPPFDLPDAEWVDIIGINGGSPTNILLNQFNENNAPSFATINSGTSALFDRLQIRISRTGSGRQVLDNFVLTPQRQTPEPGTLLLLVSGLAGFAGMRFSRTRKS